MISIIIPVYNVKDKLIACIDSIRKQTYINFQCILVDDGSTDGSNKILDEYAMLDSRFVVIHQKNRGVGAARNRGLDIAKGEYFTFIDSDDEIEPTYLESMINFICDYDILISGFTIRKEDTFQKIGTVSGPSNLGIIGKAVKEGLINSCWGKLYRKTACLSQIRFLEDIFWGEDTAFVLSCLLETKNVLFLNEHKYMYTYSLTGLANRFDKLKPYYLNIYYQYLISFLNEWAEFDTVLVRECSIKISQEIMRTLDSLIYIQFTNQEEKEYIKNLFANKEINQLFFYGIQADDNPVVLKVLARCNCLTAWHCYIKIRRRLKN